MRNLSYSNKKLITAFLIAPSSFGAIILAISLLTGNSAEGLWAFSFIVLIAYPLTITIGIPFYVLLEKLRWTGLLPYLLVGALVSIVPIGYFVIYPRVELTQSFPEVSAFPVSHIALSIIILLACLITVFVFWVIARPDKDNRIA